MTATISCQCTLWMVAIHVRLGGVGSSENTPWGGENITDETDGECHTCVYRTMAEEPWLKNGKETKRDMIAEMIPEISDLLVFRVGSLPLLV